MNVFWKKINIFSYNWVAEDVHLDRRQAVNLLAELSKEQLVQPFMVLIENRTPDKYQLKIKGNYDYKQIDLFLKDRGFSYEENEDYLIIFKP